MPLAQQDLLVPRVLLGRLDQPEQLERRAKRVPLAPQDLLVPQVLWGLLDPPAQLE